MGDAATVPEAFKIYEDGKHRRYSLLFSVNGGAFAIAKLLVENHSGAHKAVVIGNLTLAGLSYGMLAFTIVMVADIFMFGEKMRTKYVPDAFGWQGKIVLLIIGFLICLGWFLAGCG